MIAPDAAEVLHDPTETKLIVGSLVAACCLALLPLPTGWLGVRPDLVLLMLTYWGVSEPRRVGQTTAFCLGLLIDVADSNVLGVHALAYSVAAYITATLRVRVLSFTGWKQAVHIFPILFSAQAIVVLANLLLHFGFPGWSFFFGSAVGALLWPAVASLLKSRRAAARNSVA